MNLNLPPIYSGAVIHASATTSTMDIGVYEIRKWHLDRGWSDVGYHIVIRRDGSYEFGRPLERQGAHTGGLNRANGQITLGICMVGGIDSQGNVETNFTDEQWETLYEVLEEFHEKNPGGFIIGHNEAPGYESRGCPCFNSKRYVELFFDDQDGSTPIKLPDTFMDEVDTGEDIEEPWETVVNRTLQMD